MAAKNIIRPNRNDYDKIASSISEDDDPPAKPKPEKPEKVNAQQPKSVAIYTKLSAESGSGSKETATGSKETTTGSKETTTGSKESTNEKPPPNASKKTKKSSQSTTSRGDRQHLTSNLRKKPSRVDVAMGLEMATHPTYSSKFEGLVALLSFIICSSNFWLFPFNCAANGGWFPIQFTVCFLVISVPLLHMEMSLGQFASASPLYTFTQMVPAMAGLTAGMTYLLVFRMIIQSIWTICDMSVWFIIIKEMLTATSEENYEWRKCVNNNETHCQDYRLKDECTWMESGANAKCDQFQSYFLHHRAQAMRNFPFLTFLQRYLFDSEPLIAHWRPPSIQVVLAAVVVWVIVGILAIGGYKVLSKSGCFTLAILIICNCCLSIHAASFGGLYEVLIVMFTGARKETNFWKVVWSWADAAICALRAVNVGCGGVQKFASLNKFTNKIKYDVIIISVFAYFTYMGIAVYSFMYLGQLGGYYYPRLSMASRIDIFKAPATLFPSVSEVITNEKGSVYWLALLWITMPIMGIQGIASYLWIISSLVIEKLNARQRMTRKRKVGWRYRAVIVSIICAVSLLATLPLLVKSAVMTVVSIESFATYGTLFIAFFEIITIAYFYGFKRFVVNIRTMTGGKAILNVYWWINWVVLSPILLLSIFVCSIFTLEVSRTRFAVMFPLNYFGWTMMFTPIIFVVAYFIREEILRRKNREPLTVLFRPSGDWGPADLDDRKEAQRQERAARVRY